MFNFYQSEKFKKIIAYLTQNPAEATLKEKNNQLMMRKDNVKNVDDVNLELEGMYVECQGDDVIVFFPNIEA